MAANRPRSREDPRLFCGGVPTPSSLIFIGVALGDDNSSPVGCGYWVSICCESLFSFFSVSSPPSWAEDISTGLAEDNTIELKEIYKTNQCKSVGLFSHPRLNTMAPRTWISWLGSSIGSKDTNSILGITDFKFLPDLTLSLQFTAVKWTWKSMCGHQK